MYRQSTKSEVIRLLASLFVYFVALTVAFGQSNLTQAGAERSPQAMQTPGANQKIPSYAAARSRPNGRATTEYKMLWGIDNIVVKQVAGGALIRFSYRVLDPAKARVLNDEKLAPQLVDETSHYALQIPAMEQVGQLRQTATPEAGRDYWMVFSNKGGYVRPGNRVDIVIGNLRINGLVVQ